MAVTVFGLELIDEKTDQQLGRMGNLIPLFDRFGFRLVREAGNRIEERRLGDVATGNLAGSLKYQSSQFGGAAYSAGVNYAGIQQRGGTIYPNPPRKNLAIPMLKRLRRDKSWPSDFQRDRFEWKPSDKVAGVLIDKQTNELAFILVPSVTVPDRGPFLTITEANRESLRQDVENYLAYDSVARDADERTGNP